MTFALGLFTGLILGFFLSLGVAADAYLKATKRDDDPT
jgi:hypothetical protein